MYNLKFERVEYWAVDSTFDSNLFRIFKSYKSARAYIGQLKKYLINNVENLQFLDSDRDEGEEVLTFGFWQTFENGGSRYELRLFKLED